MKLKFHTSPKDCVLVMSDGTIFTSFMRSGFIKSISCMRYASSAAAMVGFSITSTRPKEGEKPHAAPYALVFISETAGQEQLSIIERFETEEEASTAWVLMHQALHRHMAVQQRKRLLKTLGRYVGLPLLIFIVSMALVRFLDSHAGSFSALNAITRASGASAATDTGRLSDQPADSLPALSPGPLGKVFSSGKSSASQTAKTAMASIHFGLNNQPPEKTLYIYSDPDSSACKRFESQIDELAQDFSIYVLPVAFKTNAAKLAAQALCATDRNAKWTDIMMYVKPGETRQGNDCPEGYRGISSNLIAYQALAFKTTPGVVNGNGYLFPKGASAAMIRLQTSFKHEPKK